MSNSNTNDSDEHKLIIPGGFQYFHTKNCIIFEKGSLNSVKIGDLFQTTYFINKQIIRDEGKLFKLDATKLEELNKFNTDGWAIEIVPYKDHIDNVEVNN